MTSMDLRPGIHNVSIRNFENEEISPVIKIKKEIDTEILLDFSLTGINKLINPISKTVPTFYLYIFLAYQNGGRDFEILSSIDFHCDKDVVLLENLNFATSLFIPADKIFMDEDFVWNYYFLNIAYSEKEVEDASDINYLLNNLSTSLFYTKLNINSEVE